MEKIQKKRAQIDNATRKPNEDINEPFANAVLALEKAEAENAGTQLESYRIQLQAMIQSINKNGNQQRRVSGMAGGASGQNAQAVSQGLPQGQGGGIPAGGPVSAEPGPTGT